MAFSDPQEIITHIGIESGAHVADIGAGTGAFSAPLSRVVGDDGRIYAVDFQKEILKKLKNDLREKGIGNVRVFWGDIEELGGTTLSDESMDCCVVANTLFAASDKEGLCKEAFRILRRGGTLAIIDWSDSFGNLGPTADQIITERQAREIAESTGFHYQKEIPAGDHHYGMVFTKP